MERAFKRGIVTAAAYKAHLKLLGYSAQDIKIKVALAEEEKPIAPSGEVAGSGNLASFESDVQAMSGAIRT